MRRRSNMRIYAASIRPVLTYAVETRAEPGATEKLLMTIEIRQMIATTRYTIMNRKRNEFISL